MLLTLHGEFAVVNVRKKYTCKARSLNYYINGEKDVNLCVYRYIEL